jgi:23S rRNA pseudouridine2457 synthase
MSMCASGSSAHPNALAVGAGRKDALVHYSRFPKQPSLQTSSNACSVEWYVLIAFNKPFGVICKFSPERDRRTLSDYIKVANVYPAGRLDSDSEGLLLLTDEGTLQARISSPRFKLAKVYWAQVEGSPTEEALSRLRNGMDLADFRTEPAGARLIDEPDELWPRDPPIRWRANIPTAWLELTLREGKNRQVRRMTAHVGLPTLRLVRASIGQVSVQGLAPGAWRQIDAAAPWAH